jgi:hypothetical protein
MLASSAAPAAATPARRSTGARLSGLPTASAAAEGRPTAFLLPSPTAGGRGVGSRGGGLLALGLIPAAPGILIYIAVCRRVLVAICGLACGSVAVHTRARNSLAPRRCLNTSHRPLRGRLMLGVGCLAVL